MKRHLTSTLVTMAVLAAITADTTADFVTFTVCPSGCDFTTIQDAINNRIAPATIQVQAGTYNENEINTYGLPYTIVE
ncbi:MAG: hypothetical protein CMJ54_03150 [Planctomycetaceae bacterium]|nr:hypothetical protein [Planctomycetaceae bacterium]